MFRHGIESRYSIKGLMNFVDLTLINGTAAQVDNVNAGSVDVPAGQAITATMTNAEILTYAQVNGQAAMQNAPTAAEYDGVILVMSPLGTLAAKVAAVQAAEAGGVTLHREAAMAALLAAT